MAAIFQDLVAKDVLGELIWHEQLKSVTGHKQITPRDRRLLSNLGKTSAFLMSHGVIFRDIHPFSSTGHIYFSRNFHSSKKFEHTLLMAYSLNMRFIL